MKRRYGLAILLCAASVIALTPGLLQADFVGEVSDLPWFHQTWPQGCSWHCDCKNGPDSSGCSAVDFNLRAESLVIAAGNGSIAHSADIVGGLGPQFVEVSHSGGLFSDYGHLNRRFWASGSSDMVCRSVPLGYSGLSNGVDHLHFAGRSLKFGTEGSSQNNKSWEPVHGDLSNGITMNNPPFTSDGTPHSYGNADFVSGNHLEQRDESGIFTSAYMVDDSHRLDFFLHDAGNWSRQESGFGYWGRTAPANPPPPNNAPPAKSWTRRYGTTGRLLATFDPILPAAGNWAVYVFIPDKGGTSTKVRYDVGFIGELGWQYQTFVIDQNANFNKWVRLGTGRFLTTEGGQWMLSVRLIDQCGDCGDATKFVAADAALFIPENCQ